MRRGTVHKIIKQRKGDRMVTIEQGRLPARQTLAISTPLVPCEEIYANRIAKDCSRALSGHPIAFRKDWIGGLK